MASPRRWIGASRTHRMLTLIHLLSQQPAAVAALIRQWHWCWRPTTRRHLDLSLTTSWLPCWTSSVIALKFFTFL